MSWSIRPMSELGQNRKSPPALVASASPPEADIVQRLRRVRFVPQAEEKRHAVSDYRHGASRCIGDSGNKENGSS